MIMIPLPYVISLFAIAFAIREWVMFEVGERNRIFIVFLCLLAFQTALVGTRFGYGIESIREIQPITAALLPPLAYLSFRGTLGISTIWVILTPLLTAVLAALFLNDFLDIFLSFNNLIFAYLLACIGVRGSDALSWAGLNRIKSWLAILWIIFAQLVYSGIADGFIAVDYFLTAGQNTHSIVGYASIIGLAAVGLSSLFLRLKNKKLSNGIDEYEDETTHTVFVEVDRFLKQEKLYLDPDLNLNRIARRMALPTRDVSRAINRHCNQNVSQYVNGLRIEEACRLMRDEKMSITNTIYASGFNTKSNFNREFLRVTSKTPSLWRSALNAQ